MSNGNDGKKTLFSMFSKIGLCVHLKKKIRSMEFSGLNLFLLS